MHLIRSRLTAGLKHKAAKGELRQGLPVGLDYDEDDKVVLCADEAVREAIITVFPSRRNGSKRYDPGPPEESRGARLCHQPGLCRGVRVDPHPHREAVDPANGAVRARDRLVPREQWEVLIPDHHRGFIASEIFEANAARLRGNWRRPRELAGGAVREGRRCCRACCAAGDRADHADRVLGQGNCPRYVCAAPSSSMPVNTCARASVMSG